MIKERKVSTVTKDFFRHEPKAVKMPNGGWAFVSAAAGSGKATFGDKKSVAVVAPKKSGLQARKAKLG